MHFLSLTYILPLFASFFATSAQDTNLAAVKAAFDAADLPEDIFFTFDPSVLLEVAFPQTSGKDIILHSGDAGGKGPFVVAAIDPDAPTPQYPSVAEIRHFLGANFFASGEPTTNTNSTYSSSQIHISVVQPTFGV
ncbi:hypothetical protein BT96DRAFT_937261 [Gymnopus androsaceus JB14]|uniref:PEBP-like protein n=1 Tax=Gymnopus androsaceus JB14 TaxID=1447944 RepID=A0A6A4HWP5_9AGAR|nr:hypothetical protein BT96DRAFT_937261 [Gymnopus androsaceus JB14]